MDKTSIDTSLIHTELAHDNKVWVDMIRKLLAKKKRAANTDRRYIPLLLL